MFIIHNDGPLIVSCNYWQSEHAAKGFLWVTINAGAVRLLVPPVHRASIREMRNCSEVVITHGIHTGEGNPPFRGREAFEILFDDHSSSPYTIFLLPDVWDRVPAPEDYTNVFEFTVWEDRRGTPHRAVTKTCYLRTGSLPCLKAWGETE